MTFSPTNPIVRLCIQGIAAEEAGDPGKARELFNQAWTEAKDDFGKFIAAHHVARMQPDAASQLEWLEKLLGLAETVNDERTMPALPVIHSGLAQCLAELGDRERASFHHELAASVSDRPIDKGPFFHGTKADVPHGEMLMPGFGSNYDEKLVMNHIYFTAIPGGAALAASFAKGDGRERVYIVEPTGDFEHDPNVTNKKFPGNPTRSYRTAHPLRIVGEMELTDEAQDDEVVKKWKEKLANHKGEIIN